VSTSQNLVNSGFLGFFEGFFSVDSALDGVIIGPFVLCRALQGCLKAQNSFLQTKVEGPIKPILATVPNSMSFLLLRCVLQLKPLVVLDPILLQLAHFVRCCCECALC